MIRFQFIVDFSKLIQRARKDEKDVRSGAVLVPCKVPCASAHRRDETSVCIEGSAEDLCIAQVQRVGET